MFFISYLLLLFSFLFSIDSYIIRGVVYDSNENYINNATVNVEGTNIYVTSDSKGFFSIEVFDSQVCTLLVSHIGYHSVRITSDSLPKTKIILKDNPIEVNQITIFEDGNSINLKDGPILTHVITENEIANSGASNVMEILEMALPNIQVIHDAHGNNGIKIQGYNSNNIAFFIDGQRVSGEFAGNIDFSMFNLSNIDRIEVIRGGMSTIYGSGAVGGIVNFITRNNEKHSFVEYAYNNDRPILESHSITLTRKKNKIVYNLNINRKDSDGYDLTPIEESVSGRVNQTLERNYTHIMSSNINYSINKNNNVNFYVKWYNKDIYKYEKTTGAHELESQFDDIDGIILEGTLVPAREIPLYKDLLYSIRYNRVINSNSNFSISFQHELYQKNIRYPYYNGNFPTIQNEKEFEWSSANFYQVTSMFSTKISRHQVLLGIENILQNVSSNNILQGSDIAYASIFDIDTTYSLSRHSLFILDNFEFNNTIHINSGIRLDLIGESSDEFNLSPSIGIKKEFNDYILRSNYSLNYRAPSVKELYYDFPQHSPPIYGNLNLKPQKSNYFGLSIENKNWSVFEVYYNHNYNMISYVLVDPNLNQEGDEYYQTDNIDEIILYGCNISHAINITNNGSLKFTYSYTDTPEQYRNKLSGVSIHSMKSTFKYSFNSNIDLLYSYRFLSHKKIYDYELDPYDISNLYLDFKESNSQNDFYIQVGVKNLFDYKDPRRLIGTDILTSYDPGKRYYLNLIFKIKGRENA